MKLDVQIIEKYPFTIEVEKPGGEWFFFCAMANRVMAENTLEHLTKDGMVARLVDSTLEVGK